MSRSCSDPPPLIALTAGDLKGIGPEIIARALSRAEIRQSSRFLIIGHFPTLEEAFLAWGQGACHPVNGSEDLLAKTDPAQSSIPIWDPVISTAIEDKALPEMAYIRAAALGCLSGQFQAMVTAPICKESMYDRGFTFPGHTEYIAHVVQSPHPIMAFAAPGLKVSLVTVHMPLKAIFEALTPERILTTLRVSHRGLREFFGLEAPRLAICGLNPHAGENGHLGDEEQRLVIPAVQAARAEGIQVWGPLPADTVFGQAVRGRFDLVVALYHDQGLIPVKLLCFGESVNLTLGLPIVRTSVDHGVAFDIAGQGIADSSSMEAAIRLAVEIVEKRRNSPSND